MPRYTRANQKIFGDSVSASGNFGVFGSLAAGSPTYSKDPATIQSLAAFLQGWQAATTGIEDPSLEDMNGLFYLTFSQIAYILQAGIPEWNAETTYYQGQFCSASGIIYKSLTNENIGNAVSDTNHWVEYIQSVAPAKSRAKAWVTFNGRGVIGQNCTIYDSYGVSHVLKDGTGQYNVNFSPNLANGNYAWAASAGAINGQPSVAGDNNVIAGAGPIGTFPLKTAANCRLYSWEPSLGQLEDTSVISAIFFAS